MKVYLIYTLLSLLLKSSSQSSSMHSFYGDDDIMFENYIGNDPEIFYVKYNYNTTTKIKYQNNKIINKYNEIEYTFTCVESPDYNITLYYGDSLYATDCQTFEREFHIVIDEINKNLKSIRLVQSTKPSALSISISEHLDCAYPFGSDSAIAHATYKYIHLHNVIMWDIKNPPALISLYKVTLHELMHSIGYKHILDNNSVLHPYYSTPQNNKMLAIDYSVIRLGTRKYYTSDLEVLDPEFINMFPIEKAIDYKLGVQPKYYPPSKPKNRQIILAERCTIGFNVYNSRAHKNHITLRLLLDLFYVK